MKQSWRVFMPHGWAQRRSLCNSSGIHWVLRCLNHLYICLFIKLFLPTCCCSPLGGDASRTSKPLKLVDNFVWGTNDFNPAKNKVSLEDSLSFSKEIEVLFFFIQDSDSWYAYKTMIRHDCYPWHIHSSVQDPILFLPSTVLS